MVVLRLLEQREMYGYEMIEALSRRTGGVLAMGHSTLYTLLYSLERKKLVRASWRAADTGRQRKYYGLTKKGRAYLRAQERQWTRLVAALAGLGLVEGNTAEE